MFYETERKKYYRFPSNTNLIDFEEYTPQYFPSKNEEQNENYNIGNKDSYKISGDIL